MKLRSADHVNSKSQTVNYKVGQIVLIFQEKIRKHVWTMGIIGRMFIGRDGKVRSCAVRLPSRTIIKRPV